MSLGGRDEPSLGVIVYGPDGTAYGSPAQAIAAGVENATMSAPAGFPISYPGRQPYTPTLMPNIPTPSSGGRNRYAEIMANYQQAQPLSFTGMPSTYTGGYDATPYQAYSAPANRYEEIMSQQAMGGGGRGEREAPSAFSLMSPAERAVYYSQNPTEGKIALGMQDLFGNVSLMGQLAKNFGSGGWYDSRLEKMGVNPTISVDTQGILAGTSMQKALNALNPSGGFVSTPDTQAVQNAINNTDFSGMDRGSTSNAPSTPDTQSVQDSINNTDFSGMDSGSYAQGGYVSMQHLGGPNPMGPDDGYAALKDGEYVINDKAVKKYGIELMNAINSGKISKGKLRGLLEM